MRLKKSIDPETVEKLAASGCSAEQIAALLKVDLERRFAPVIKKGRLKAHGRLQAKLFQDAMNGNAAPQIFLAKNWLGMSDRQETVVNVQQISRAPAFDKATKRRLVQISRVIYEEAKRQHEANHVDDRWRRL